MSEIEKVLYAIEDLCADDFIEDLQISIATKPNKFSNLTKRLVNRLGSIYKIAHAHNKDHLCYDSHGDWRDEFHDAPVVGRG